MSDPSPTSASDESDDDALEYRSLEPVAIVSVLLGLASPVAIFQPLLAVLPILGLLTAGVALTKIGATGPAAAGAWHSRASCCRHFFSRCR